MAALRTEAVASWTCAGFVASPLTLSPSATTKPSTSTTTSAFTLCSSSFLSCLIVSSLENL
jgi:hypothetical protein